MRTWRLQFLVVSTQQMSGLSIASLEPAAWRLFQRDSQIRGAGVEEDAGEETLQQSPQMSAEETVQQGLQRLDLKTKKTTSSMRMDMSQVVRMTGARMTTSCQFGLCRTPIWLMPFWCRRRGVLVHGWCAEKENRGKGGSGQGKIGAGVGTCRSMDPVGIQSGCSWAPILHFWAPLLASRDPDENQRQTWKFL